MTNNPTVILIYGDAFGRGMLRCYGQQGIIKNAYC